VDREPADEGRSRIAKGRLEGISDGIMAVAITLLALNISPPERAPGETLWQAIDAQVLGEIGIFRISFFLIARYWILHHAVFSLLPDHVGIRVVLVNFAFLATVCLMPFTTELYSRNTDDITGIAVYAVVIAIGSALVSVLYALAGRAQRSRTILVPAIFLLAIPVAMVTSPSLAPLTWLLLFLVPESRRPPGRPAA
jgi:uncharacterized membrane protein